MKTKTFIVLFLAPFFIGSTAKTKEPLTNSVKYQYSGWMHDNLHIIGDKKISEITIVGSHDSGTEKRNGGTSFSNNCNTKTQTKNILGQLKYGARYFDIRPVISGGEFYTGHYGKVDIDFKKQFEDENKKAQKKIIKEIEKHTKIDLGFLGKSNNWLKKERHKLYEKLPNDVKNVFEKPKKYPPKNSWQGANGESISSIVDQINEFTKEKKELVILNISHSLNTDVGNSKYRKFNKSEWNRLINELSKINHLYVSNQSDINITSLKLKDLISNRSAVVVVMEDLKEEDIGEYLSKGFYSKSSFNVVNKYSNTHHFKRMLSDQREKMKKHEDDYFLLSWTLTQSKEQTVSCLAKNNKVKIPYLKVKTKHIAGIPYPDGIETKHKTITLFNKESIVDLADYANNRLHHIKKHITHSVKPNIIYIDNVNDDKAVKLALDINKTVVYEGNKDSLTDGQSIKQGEFLVSKNGSFKLIMQKDGNLVIYDMYKKAIWSTHTNHKGGERLLMRNDGILTVYKKNNSHAWSSSKKKRKGGTHILKMQDDGNLVDYHNYKNKNKAIWSSRTSR